MRIKDVDGLYLGTVEPASWLLALHLSLLKVQKLDYKLVG